MRKCTWPIEELLPHRKPMLLLDRVDSWDETALCASASIDTSGGFLDADGVPAFVALEYMAQACGAWAGCQAHDQGLPPKIGYLLGTRDFSSSRRHLKPGEELAITVKLVFKDGPFGLFFCRVIVADETVASAEISVYQVADEIQPRDAAVG